MHDVIADPNGFKLIELIGGDLLTIILAIYFYRAIKREKGKQFTLDKWVSR